jgi:hypothetical protein
LKDVAVGGEEKFPSFESGLLEIIEIGNEREQGLMARLHQMNKEREMLTLEVERLTRLMSP